MLIIFVQITYLEEMGHTPETLKLANLLFEHKRVIGLCDSRNIVLKFLTSHN